MIFTPVKWGRTWNMNRLALKRMSSTCNWYRKSINDVFSVKSGKSVQIRDRKKIIFLI